MAQKTVTGQTINPDRVIYSLEDSPFTGAVNFGFDVALASDNGMGAYDVDAFLSDADDFARTVAANVAVAQTPNPAVVVKRFWAGMNSTGVTTICSTPTTI
jgi:hypothetical protein